MIFGLLYFCVVILCVNRSRSSFILYRIVKRHSRQSNVRRIWTCADNGGLCRIFLKQTLFTVYDNWIESFIAHVAYLFTYIWRNYYGYFVSNW